MAANGFVQHLQSSLSLVAETLAAEEAVLMVEKGRTRYARQTFAFYKVRIGTFKNMTGNEPVDLRSAVVEVNVDPPYQARYVDESEWLPLPQ